MEWYHVWWPWLTFKRVARFVSDSWVSCSLLGIITNFWLKSKSQNMSTSLATAKHNARQHSSHTQNLARRGDVVKLFHNVVWLPCKIGLLFLIPCVRMSRSQEIFGPLGPRPLTMGRVWPLEMPLLDKCLIPQNWMARIISLALYFLSVLRCVWTQNLGGTAEP